jgi:DNA invertase Pin-like site-specific DNA recombinase
MQRLVSSGIKLQVLDQQIDTSTPTGMLLFTMLGAIATFENDLRKDRQMQGIDLAKRKGIKFGRKRSLSSEQIQEVLLKRSEGIKVVDLMAEYGLSKASIYRALGGVNQVQN